MSADRQRGVTLIDLVVAIVVISIGVTAVLSVFVVTTRGSVDPMIRQQAHFFAEAYLEEILLKAFYDPDSGTVCPAAEGSRAAYDNVCDYNGVNQPPTDQFGNAIAGISGYNVLVAVAATSPPAAGAPSLNGLVNGPAANEIRVLRIDVTVTAPGYSTTLTGYRTNYNCNVSADAGCRGL